MPGDCGSALERWPLDKLRSVQGIVALADKYPAARVEAACDTSLRFGDPSGRRIRTIHLAGTDLEPVEKVVQLRLVSFDFARGASEFCFAGGDEMLAHPLLPKLKSCVFLEW